MKNYKEVADNVLRRSGEIIEKNNRRRRTITKVGSAAGCLAVAGAVGVGVWANAGRNNGVPVSEVQSAGQFAPGVDPTGKSDVVVDHNDLGGSVRLPGVSGSAEPINGGIIRFTPELEDPEYIENMHFIPTVRYYGDGSTPKETSIPENGKTIISKTLKDAAEEYGAKDTDGCDILYVVAIDFYGNGEKLAVETDEIKVDERARLGELGLWGGFETSSSDWGRVVKYCFYLNLTKEQLENFPASEKYGYVLSLYGETLDRMPQPDTDPMCFSGQPNIDPTCFYGIDH